MLSISNSAYIMILYPKPHIELSFSTSTISFTDMDHLYHLFVSQYAYACTADSSYVHPLLLVFFNEHRCKSGLMYKLWKETKHDFTTYTLMKLNLVFSLIQIQPKRLKSVSRHQQFSIHHNSLSQPHINLTFSTSTISFTYLDRLYHLFVHQDALCLYCWFILCAPTILRNSWSFKITYDKCKMIILGVSIGSRCKSRLMYKLWKENMILLHICLWSWI